MNQAVEERKSGQSLPAVRKRQSLPVPCEHGLETASRSKRAKTDAAVQAEHPSDRKARLEEQGENGKLHRWKQKAFTGAFIGAAFILLAVWAAAFLSGRFSPEDKEQVTGIVKTVLFGMACLAAGKGLDKWIGS